MQQGLLPGSIAMLVFGCTLLYGGLTLFISIAMRAEKGRK